MLTGSWLCNNLMKSRYQFLLFSVLVEVNICVVPRSQTHLETRVLSSPAYISWPLWHRPYSNQSLSLMIVNDLTLTCLVAGEITLYCFTYLLKTMADMMLIGAGKNGSGGGVVWVDKWNVGEMFDVIVESSHCVPQSSASDRCLSVPGTQHRLFVNQFAIITSHVTHWISMIFFCYYDVVLLDLRIRQVLKTS